MQRAPGRWAAELVGVAVAYYAAARLGLLLQLPGTNASPFWPPSGIGLAAVLVFGLRIWPAIAVAAFLANLTTFPGSGDTPLLIVVLAAAGIAVGNTLEHLVAWWLIRRAAAMANPFERARNAGWFVVAAMLACLIASSNGALWISQVTGKPLADVWVTWWTGDCSGMIVLTPALYLGWKTPWRSLSAARAVELVLVVALTAAIAEFLFGGWIEGEVATSLPYLVVPGLLWSAFRFGPRETSALAVIVSCIAVAHTWASMGELPDILRLRRAYAPFVSPQLTANESLLLLQVFVSAIAVTAVTLAVAVRQQKYAEREVRRLNAELEQRVRDRTAELEAANKELEAFSYSVSHDLRRPLRAIDGFSRILQEEHTAALPAAARDLFTLVRANAHEMGQLIEDLLLFSKLSRHPVRKRAIDPVPLVRQCLAELENERKGRRVEITIGNLPTCRAEPTLLHQVLINLLSNALKYTRNKEVAQVEIGCRRDEGSGEAVYFVRDNGVGFNMRYAHKLFGAFQRLHRPEDYEGTGVGLAIVKRIIQRHGGRIWAEAEPGQGATFFFTVGD